MRNLDLVADNLYLLLTKEHLMRGYEYRAGRIDLLLTVQFEHEGAVMQAIGRVGHHKDKGRVFKLPGLQLVNSRLKCDYIGAISRRRIINL